MVLAAVGRLLAGAVPLGRLNPEQSPDARVYAFRAAPDGLERDVLVGWANRPTRVSWLQDISPEAVYDYLGRPITTSLPANLTPLTLFIILASGDATKLTLQQPVSGSAPRPGSISPVVLQLQMPRSTTNLDHQAHIIPAATPTGLGLFAYNFRRCKVSGTVTVQQAPANWEIAPTRWTVVLEPMERMALPAHVIVPSAGAGATAADWVKLQGDFGPAGRPVLAFRLMVKEN